MRRTVKSSRIVRRKRSEDLKDTDYSVQDRRVVSSVYGDMITGHDATEVIRLSCDMNACRSRNPVPWTSCILSGRLNICF